MIDRRSFLATSLAAAPLAGQTNSKPFRIAVGGLTHGHAGGFLNLLKRHPEAQLVGVSDPTESLRASYAKRFNLAPEILYGSIGEMLERTKPEAVALFGSTFDHAAGVEAAAAHKLPVMMEKPLAVSMEHARRIEAAAKKSGIAVIVNYETTWYASHGEIWRFIKEKKAAGDIRKMVAMDGHPGPKEIGVGPEFLSWLTDPKLNGAGALFDFGCYGANLFTWLMDNQRPRAVTARTLTIKPHIYGKVDDEATIIVDYAQAQGIAQASWNWPYHRKDFEVYGVSACMHAIGGNTVRVRRGLRDAEETLTPGPLAPNESDSVAYLKAIARGELKPAGLSSLENNMIVTEILTAARESARTGKTVTLA